jgi:hypothetical protein
MSKSSWSSRLALVECRPTARRSDGSIIHGRWCGCSIPGRVAPKRVMWRPSGRKMTFVPHGIASGSNVAGDDVARLTWAGSQKPRSSSKQARGSAPRSRRGNNRCSCGTFPLDRSERSQIVVQNLGAGSPRAAGGPCWRYFKEGGPPVIGEAAGVSCVGFAYNFFGPVRPPPIEVRSCAARRRLRFAIPTISGASGVALRPR